MRCATRWAIIALVLATTTAARSDWTESTFEDFADGTFDDGGVNCYVSAQGRVQLINRWDYNNDGYIDLIFSNSHDYSEIVDAFVYIGGPDGATPTRRLRLPSNGGALLTVRDLNRDGVGDVIIGNASSGSTTKTNLCVYWGGEDGHPERRLTVLPAHSVRSLAAGDFNGDGWDDVVVLSDVGQAAYPESPGSRCYWGGEYGFAFERSQDVDWASSATCSAGDFNRDGRDDLAVATDAGVTVYWGERGDLDRHRASDVALTGVHGLRSGDVNADGCADLVVCRSGSESTVLAGAAAGLSAQRSIAVPVDSPVDCAIGDLNDDGRPDLAFAASIPDGENRSSVVLYAGDDGFSATRRMLLPTCSPSDVAVGDVNGDGAADVAFANQSRAKVYDIESYVYLGGPGGLAPDRRLDLPTSDANAVAVADVSGDGAQDVVFVNGRSGSGLPPESDVYWGDASGTYATDRHTTLPTVGGYGTTAADYNDDGHTDVLMNNCEAEAGSEVVGSYLFWGGPDGISRDRMGIVPTQQSIGSATADLNRDGYLDLFVNVNVGGNNVIFWGGKDGFSAANETELVPPDPSLRAWEVGRIADLNADGYLDLVATQWYTPFSLIWWGGPDGYAPERTTKLPGRYSVGADAADLNADGYLDLVLVNYWEPDLGNDPRTFSYIYWGSAKGYSPFNRAELPTVGATQARVADFDRDGALDIFITNYDDRIERMLDSYIYWGNADAAYSVQNRQRLYNDSACGSLEADLNGDGWLDLVVANHRRLGNHACNSRIFYGGPNGFSDGNMALLPTHGVHYMAGADMGHVYHRRLEWVYTSSPHDTGGGPQYGALSWASETPHGTGVKFQLRSAATREGLDQAAWLGPDGPDSWHTRSGEPVAAGHGGQQWVQYRMMLTTLNGAASPVVSRVSIAY